MAVPGKAFPFRCKSIAPDNPFYSILHRKILTASNTEANHQRLAETLMTSQAAKGDRRQLIINPDMFKLAAALGTPHIVKLGLTTDMTAAKMMNISLLSQIGTPAAGTCLSKIKMERTAATT